MEEGLSDPFHYVAMGILLRALSAAGLPHTNGEWSLVPKDAFLFLMKPENYNPPVAPPAAPGKSNPRIGPKMAGAA